MKIDFIIGSLSGGGAERVLVLLATEMAKTHNVTIITFGGDDKYTIENTIKRVSLDKFSIQNHTVRRYFELYSFYRDKKNRPNILISFLPTISLVTIPISRLLGIKIICSEHINYLQVENKAVKFTRNNVYKYANALTVLTNFDKDYYLNKGIKTFVMPNPSTFKVFRKDNQRNKEIIAVGNLDRYYHKGFDNLIDLITPVLLQYPDWKLRIIGSGGEGKEYLQSLIGKTKLQDQVIFDGFRNDVDKIMQSASIFVLCSRFEGLPMVLLEAMSQGMACIAYDCKTGPSEMITHNYNGMLIEDQNKTEMKKGLLELISNEKLRYDLGNKALKAVDKFAMPVILKKWEAIFNNL
ncbi:glycosyltransferase family 4 protein [Maribacter sp. MJ134]|uniref:glycosyltransferase family 4 protein n=1 Tax=Maribacter sp. MJ134 TaxID=2496865 RepID=UPI000F83CE5C|nr:glycosyltransferase family 4 protein [Maribacter sp. MJ134]AZQ58473.1 glycosyltransferase family 4 protein [Maribacter sp. MJ134]